DIKRKAASLVRLALFVEQRRSSLRRDEIVKKVLGGNGRLFKTVFDQAQTTLRSTFGMELVELRTRAQLEQNDNPEEEAGEARAAIGVRKKNAAGSKTYILRSVLEPILIEYAALTDEQIYEEESQNMDADEADDEDENQRACGSIISWNTSDQLGSIGVLYVILGLILADGRVISDMDLRGYLKRLRLGPKDSMSLSPLSTHRSVSVDQFLTTLLRQGFVDRDAIGETKTKSKGKRVRAQADDDGGPQYEWRWGPRAHSEIGERAVAQFMAEFMVGGNEEDEEGENGLGQDKRQDEVHLERMARGIERAAGGNLSDIK
ncbi:MAGE protein, partial [Fistulina hepatica ATCC 64428]